MKKFIEKGSSKLLKFWGLKILATCKFRNLQISQPAKFRRLPIFATYEHCSLVPVDCFLTHLFGGFIQVRPHVNLVLLNMIVISLS